MSLPAFLQIAGYRRIPLSRNGVGHFEAAGTLAGRSVRVLIDTGAASTVVSLALARELGLVLTPLGAGRGEGRVAQISKSSGSVGPICGWVTRSRGLEACTRWTSIM